MTAAADTPAPSLLSECRTALGAASPGPWEIRVTMPGTPSEMTDVWRGTEDEGEYVAQDVTPEDGALIVAARRVMPRLVGAVEAVLEMHRPIDRGTGAQCKGCATHVTLTWWPCPTYRAITRELAGERENESAHSAATREDGGS